MCARLPPAAALVGFLFGASGWQSGGSRECRERLLAQLRGLHVLLQSFLQLFRAAELLMEKLEAAWQGVERTASSLQEGKESLREHCGWLCRRLPQSRMRRDGGRTTLLFTLHHRRLAVGWGAQRGPPEPPFSLGTRCSTG